MPVPSLAGRQGRYRKALSCTTNGRRDATVGAIIFAGRQYYLNMPLIYDGGRFELRSEQNPSYLRVGI